MVSTNTLNCDCSSHQLRPFASPFRHHRKNEITVTWCEKTFKKAWFLTTGLAAMLFLFSNTANAQCSASCVDHTEIALDNTGFRHLTPQMFYNGDPSPCVTISIVPQQISCDDVGNLVVVTLTAVDVNNVTSTCRDTFLVVDSTPPQISCPSNVTLSCGSSTDPASTGTPIVTDNCDWHTPVMVSFSDVVTGGSVDCQVITRTWTAVDGSANISTCAQTITIQDNNNPVLDFNTVAPGNQTTPPANTSRECDNLPVVPPSVNASDGCAGFLGGISPVDVEVNRSANPFDCEYYDYDILRTWTATDNCGRSTSATQLISVFDATAPVFSASTTHLQIPTNNDCEAPVSLNLSGSVTDNCTSFNYLLKTFAVRSRVSGALVRSGTGLDASGIYEAGDYNFVFLAVDPCGNIDSLVRRVTIIDNIAPVVSCLGVVTISVPASGTVMMSPDLLDNGSFDNCTPIDQLIYSTNPSTLTCADINTIVPVWLIVTDANGNVDSCYSEVFVEAGPPATFCDTIVVYLDGSGFYTLTEADLDSIGRQSYDACDADTLEFSASQTVFDCDDIGNNIITFTSTNDYGESSSCQAMVTVLDDVDPEVQGNCQAFSANLDENGKVTLEGGWLLGGDYEVFMKTRSQGGSATNTDFTATIDVASSFMLNWDFFTDDAVGHDRFGYLLNGVFTRLDNLVPPVAISLAPGDVFGFRMRSDNDQNLSVARAYGFPMAFFTGSSHPVNWTKTNLANGSAFIAGSIINTIDNCTSPWDLTITANPSMLFCEDISSNPNDVIVTVTDESGNSDTCVANVSVFDVDIPEFECQDFLAQLSGDDVTVEPGWFLDGPYNIFMESRTGSSGNTDYTVKVKSPVTVSFHWDFESADAVNAERFGYLKNGVFTRLSPSAATGSGNTSVSLAQGDVFGFRMISDADGLIARAVISGFNINFTGDFDPVWWVRQLNGGNGRVFIYGSSVGDNCSEIGDISILFSIDGSDFISDSTFTCADLASIFQVDVEVADAYGNADTCTAELDVIDIEPPVAGCPPPFSTTLNQDGEYLVANPINLGIVALFSSDNCEIDTITVSPNILNCNNIGPNTVTFTVYDLSGNSSTCTTVINIQETTPPVIFCPADTVVSCSNLPQDTMPARIGMATATDNCSAVAMTYTTSVVSSSGPNCYTLRRVWKATDLSGNMRTCSQTITVVDTVAPSLTITSAQLNTTIYTHPPVCGPSAPVDPAYSDNCSATLTRDTIDSRISYPSGTFIYTPAQSQYYNYTITRNWTVSDGCGHIASHSQIVTVADTTAPQFLNSTMIMVNNEPGQCRAFVNLRITADSIVDCAAFPYLTFTNNSIRGNGADNASGYYSVHGSPHVITFTATDPSGNTRSHTVTVIVKDLETPTAVCANNNSVQVVLNSNGIGTLSIGAINAGSSDNCGIASLTLSRTQFTCADLGPQQVVLTVADAAGNTSRCTTNVIVVDGSSIAINCPSAITVNCSQSIDPSVTGTPTFTSNCGNAVLSFNDVTLSGNSVDCRVIERTWSVTNGNTTESCTQLITVVDNVAPTLPPAPASVTVNCHSVPALVNLTASDNCAGNFSVAPAQTSTQNGNPNTAGHYNYNLTRIWTATDNCGNSTSTAQVITVQDVTSPTLSFPSPHIIATATNQCDTFVNIDLLAFISDNCAPDANLSITVNGVGGNSVISGAFGVGTYNFSVFVSDPSGNTTSGTYTLVIQDQQSPDAICFQNIIIVLDNTGNATITPADIDDGSTDNCTPDAQLLLSVNPSAFTTADIGPVQITLTVTDQTGNVNTCVTNATVVSGTLLQADNVVSIEGSMDTVPVTVTQFNDVTAFQLDLDVTSGAVASAADIVNIHPGLSQGILLTSSNANGFFVTWIDTSGTPGLDLLDGTQLFGLKVNITGTDGDVTPVTIANLEVSQLIAGVSTIVTSYGLNGSITVVSGSTNFTLAGDINTETGVPVELANVVLTGSVGGSVITGVTGTYGFVVPSGASSTITPSKNINWRNGVTTGDALRVLQHIGGTPLNSPYKIIAADANKDGLITSNDASNILLLALNYIGALPNNTSWRFVPEVPALPANPFSAPFDEFFHQDPVSMDLLDIDFIGIKIGDVNNTVDASMRPLSTSLDFRLEDQWIEEGEVVAVPVKAKDFIGIDAYQFTYEFNANLLEFVETVPGNLPNFTPFNINSDRAEEGKLATGWLNVEPVTMVDEEVLFTLYFRGRKGGFYLSEVLNAGSSYIQAEVVAGDKLGSEINLVFGKVTSTGQPNATQFELRQNIPNPFTQETTIGFVLPVASEAVLTISDVSGKVVKQIRGSYPAGYNQVKLDSREFSGNGVFIYRLDTEKQTAVRKMIFLEK